MPISTHGLLEPLRWIALTALGLILAATPLALWVAWSQPVFVLILVTGGLAGVFFYLLYVDHSEPDERGRTDHREKIHRLDERVLSELSDMGPFVYHNRLSGDSRFVAGMRRLKQSIAVERRRDRPSRRG